MKNTFTFFLLLIFFILQDTNVSGQWMPSQGMDGVSCQSLVTLDSTLFACTGGNGVYARNIYGGEWQQKFPSNYIRKISRAGDVLFAEAYNYNYRSMDHGETWETLDSLIGQSHWIVTLDTLVFFTNYYSVYLSDDYGEFYYPVFTTPYTGTNFLFGNDQTLFCRSYSSTHLYYSLNRGVSWDSIPNNGLPVNISARDIYNFNNEFWLTCSITWQSSGVYKWDNGSQTWQLSDTISLEQFGTYNNALHACGTYGFYRHDTITNHWILLNTETEPSNILGFCSVDSLLFCGASPGIYRSGASYSWQPYYDGLYQATVTSLAALGDEVWAITNCGLFKSSDDGGLFEKQNTPYPDHPIKILLTDSYYCMISNEGFSLSGDYGISWINFNAGLTVGLIPDDLAGNSEFRFLTYGHDVYRSSLALINWQKILSDSTLYFRDVVADDSVVLVIAYNSTGTYNSYFLLRSTNQGITFDSISPGGTTHYDYEIYLFNPNNNLLALSHHSIYQSTDEGLTWQLIPVSDPEYYGEYLTQNDLALIVSGSKLGGTLYDTFLSITYDDGNIWTDIRGNLPKPSWPLMGPVETHEGRTLAAVSENGLWYRDDLLTHNKQITQQKNEFLKVAPNPASEKITVDFILDKNESGNLHISDLLGRMVYDSGNKEFREGSNQTSIDIQFLNPGLYIISFNANGKPLHGKFIKSSR